VRPGTHNLNEERALLVLLFGELEPGEGHAYAIDRSSLPAAITGRGLAGLAVRALELLVRPVPDSGGPVDERRIYQTGRPL
jgi:hypothetical protein